MRRLLKLLGRKAPGPRAPFDALLAPDWPLAVIGDMRGRDNLLGRLLDWLAAEASEHQVVLVGDLMDWGERSADVVPRLQGRDDLVVLRGNHEEMCLNFLDEPKRKGPLWLRNGGLQTLASFGVGGLDISPQPPALRDAAERLEDAMGAELISWPRSRPVRWQSGNVAAVHAGADPVRPIEDQEEATLLCGHSRFDTEARADGVWAVHGHTILETLTAAEGRVGVDTGAYATGRLTGARIRPGQVSFLAA